MGMSYRFSGSASYSRFHEEISRIDELVQSDDVIFTSWIADPYKELSYEDTEHIADIILHFMENNPEVELPYQPINELDESLAFKEGWFIYR